MNDGLPVPFDERTERTPITPTGCEHEFFVAHLTLHLALPVEVFFGDVIKGVLEIIRVDCFFKRPSSDSLKSKFGLDLFIIG